MKLRHLLALLLGTLLIVACNQDPKSKSGDKAASKTEESNDSVKVIKEKYSNGNLRYVKEVLNTGTVKKPNWVLHGTVKEYYEKKKNCLAVETTYDHGKKEGFSTKYYQTGEKYFETPYSKGKMDGVKKKFYRSGKVMAESPYKQNFLGLGTQEYNSKGEPLTMPALKVWVKDDRRASGKYTVYAKVVTKMGKTAKRCDFFSGLLIESKYSHPNLKPITDKKGVASITFYESQGFPPFVNIVAKHITAKGTPVLFSKMHQIK